MSEPLPSLSSYDNALLTANRLIDRDGTQVGALYSSEGWLIPESVRQVDRSDVHMPTAPSRVDRPEVVIGHYNHPGYELWIDEAIFGGHVISGWGHTITETLSTAWAASQHAPHLPLLLVPWGRAWATSFSRLREVLSMAGWGERPLLIASGDAVLGRVHVPERLIRLDDLMYEHRPIPDLMNDVYDRMVAASSVQTTNACRPVFLPRPEGHRRAHPEEKAIADAISELGVISIRGWQMSARQQVAAVSSASALIGFSGSNLHNSLFAQRGTAVIEILDERATAHFGTERRDLQQPLCDLREQPLFPVPSFSNGTPLSSAAVVSAVASALRGRQGRL